MKLRYDVVDIKDIIKFWVDAYKFKEGESLYNNKFYYDPHRGKVVLELSVNEAGDDK